MSQSTRDSSTECLSPKGGRSNTSCIEPVPMTPQKANRGEDKEKTKCWLSCELRLDDFSVKTQMFCVTGWINVFWRWDEKMPQAAKFLISFNDTKDDEKRIDNADKTSTEIDEDERKESKVISWINSRGDEIVKIGDLRNSKLTYYLPIDSRKIFNQRSTASVEHIEPPALYYNKRTRLCHTQYYITAGLTEHLELFTFPFDRQFLNLKLRWNVDYYRLLNYGKDDKAEVKEWFDIEHKADEEQQNGTREIHQKKVERNLAMYHTYPLQVTLKESLQDEVQMHDAWVDFKVRRQGSDDASNGLRFALIRLRIRRRAKDFVTSVILPFIIIVSSSFSVFAISPDEPADRLGLSVGILLTFTAFQSIVGDALPQTNQVLLIDLYIGLAYLVQALIIFHSCIVSLFEDIETVEWYDHLFAGITGLIWIIMSLCYTLLAFGTIRNCWDKMCYKSCCPYSHISFNDWEQRARNEIDEWAKSKGKIYRIAKMTDWDGDDVNVRSVPSVCHECATEKHVV